MDKEKAAFAARLRGALEARGIGASPAVLEKRFNSRYGGAAVTAQAISGWLNGRAMPRQGNMRALARMLSMEPQQLQFGSDKHVRETRGEWRMNPHDQRAIETFLRLPASQRKLVRSLIEELSKQHAPAKAAKKR